MAFRLITLLLALFLTGCVSNVPLQQDLVAPLSKESITDSVDVLTGLTEGELFALYRDQEHVHKSCATDPYYCSTAFLREIWTASVEEGLQRHLEKQCARELKGPPCSEDELILFTRYRLIEAQCTQKALLSRTLNQPERIASCVADGMAAYVALRKEPSM